MELPDAFELMAYWAQHPPVHLAIAALVRPKVVSRAMPSMTAHEESLSSMPDRRFDELPDYAKDFIRETNDDRNT